MNAPLRLTRIALRVAQLDRSVAYYTGRLGFTVVTHDADQAQLAVATGAPALLTLHAGREAPPPPRDSAGLFHAALLFPSRPALGAWLRTALAENVALDGASDHGVSEAIYLSDPDGNGLEFYADRPRSAWPFAADGELAMTTRRLDLPRLLTDADPEPAGTLAGAHWGHLHLRVTDLERSEAFYRANLGLVVTQSTYPGARFLAAGGYHHHLGLNTWGNPRRPQPPGALGLVAATFARPAAAAQERRPDPDGIMIEIGPD